MIHTANGRKGFASGSAQTFRLAVTSQFALLQGFSVVKAFAFPSIAPFSKKFFDTFWKPYMFAKQFSSVNVCVPVSAERSDVACI